MRLLQNLSHSVSKKGILLGLVFCTTQWITIAQTSGRCVQGNCSDGYGTLELADGSKYYGDFSLGKYHGKGIMDYADGSEYRGNWQQGKRQGGGLFVFPNGNEYRGAFNDNKMEGLGVLKFAAGGFYEGEWLNNSPEGKGKYHFTNGNLYEGEIKQGAPEGEGKMLYADGSQFEGSWKNGKKHGEGVLVYPAGGSLRGTWVDDVYGSLANLFENMDTTNLRNCNQGYCDNTRGSYEYRDGARYYGMFIKGKPTGDAVVVYRNGDGYQGEWVNDNPNGRGTMYYKTGQVVSAVWREGKVQEELFRLEAKGSAQVGREVNVDTETSGDTRIFAVIVGAAHYLQMPPLRYTDDDAYQFYAFLKSMEGGSLPDKQIRLLIDENASKSAIMNAIQGLFMQADANDVIIFYFSGHGLPGAFIPIDSDGVVNRLEHRDVKAIIERSRAKHKLVIADACHAGTFVSAKAPEQELLDKYYEAFKTTRPGTALLVSSKGEEYSLEDGGLRSGVFSHFVVRGLKGDADIDLNKIVTVSELYNYVFKHVRKHTLNVQSPVLTGDYDSKMPVAVVRR